jgi:hypothetical protein
MLRILTRAVQNNSSNYVENINQNRTKFIHLNGQTPRIFLRLRYYHPGAWGSVVVKALRY